MRNTSTVQFTASIDPSTDVNELRKAFVLRSIPATVEFDPVTYTIEARFPTKHFRQAVALLGEWSVWEEPA